MRHPKLFRFVAEHLVGPATKPVPDGNLHCGRGLDEFSSQGVGNLLWSFARQGQISLELPILKGRGRMGIFVTMQRDVGEPLLKRLCNCCVEHVLEKYADLDSLSTCDISNTAWALAIMGIHHRRFFEAVETQVAKRCVLSMRMSCSAFLLSTLQHPSTLGFHVRSDSLPHRRLFLFIIRLLFLFLPWYSHWYTHTIVPTR